MKLLVTGNSLAGALRNAWPAIADDHPEIELDFFVAPQKIFIGLETDGEGNFGLPEAAGAPAASRDWLERLNGRLSVRLADYDAIIVVGLHFRIGAMLRTMADYRVDGLKTIHTGGRLMSRRAFHALHDDVIGQELELLSGFPAECTIVIPGNRPAEGVGGDEGFTGEIWAPVDSPDAGLRPTIDLLYGRVAEAIAARGMTPILQPPDTLVASGLTRAEFAGGPRLDPGRNEDSPRRDHAHLTVAFGARLWQPILAEIARRAEG
ncbi:MAG: hypothetical protein ABR601_00570 [Parasphingopyxis sp.]|nr:hypothetical protein [Sphingomonadales bacterium]